MNDALDYRLDFTPAQWEAAWAKASARLTQQQREMLAVSSSLPSPSGLAECASEGPVHWKESGGDPTLQAVWAMALRELVPADLPTVTVDDEAWDEPRVVAAHVVFSRPMSWRAPIVILGDVQSSHPLSDCGPDSCVTIVGRVAAPGLVTSGELQIIGDVDVPLIEGHYNDNVLIVLGDVNAQLIYEEQHACNWGGNVTARAHASLDDSHEEQEQKLVETVLPELLSERWPRLGPAMTALASGQQVLRER